MENPWDYEPHPECVPNPRKQSEINPNEFYFSGISEAIKRNQDQDDINHEEKRLRRIERQRAYEKGLEAFSKRRVR